MKRENLQKQLVFCPELARETSTADLLFKKKWEGDLLKIIQYPKCDDVKDISMNLSKSTKMNVCMISYSQAFHLPITTGP